MKHKNIRYGSLLVTTALVLTPFSAGANEIFYKSVGDTNTFTATVSGTGNRIGTDAVNQSYGIDHDFSYDTPLNNSTAVVDLARSYTIVPYDESKQIGNLNTATVDQNGNTNKLSFTQGSQGGVAFDYNFSANATDGNGGTNDASDFFNAAGTLLSYLATASVDEASGNSNALTVSQLGDDNQMAIYQLGNGNSVSADQANNGNLSRINQLGDSDSVIGDQNGISNVADVLQSDVNYGRLRSATYTQNGDNNIASIFQGDIDYSGNNAGSQTATIFQSQGNNNEAAISQVNGPGTASISLTGSSNLGFITQNNSGDGSEAYIVSAGDENEAYVYQADADGSLATLTQTGDTNVIELSQLNLTGNATIEQTGDLNTAYVIQTEANLTVDILQDGNGGTVNIYN